MQLRASRLPLAALVVVAAAVAAAAGGATYAAFSAPTANPASTFESMAIFSRSRTSSAWDVRDRSTGAESNVSNVLAFSDDGRTLTTKSWTGNTQYNTDRYLELDFNDPLPGGRSTSSVDLRFRFSTTSGTTACFYYDVRKASDNSVLATYGGNNDDQGCVTGTTATTHVESLPIVTTTDEADDLRIRIYVRRPTSGTVTVDRAVVTIPFTYSTLVLYPKKHDDRANGSSAVTWWGPAVSGDNVFYQSATTWSSSFAADKYVTVKFPTTVPNAATVTSATVDVGFRRAPLGGLDVLDPASGEACIYFQVLNGSTVVETHGAGTPFCNSTGSFAPLVTRTLTAVNTAGKANNLSLRIYGRTTTGVAIQFDLVRLNTVYAVDADVSGGASCVDPGSAPVVTARDGWTDQASPTSTSGGTDSKLFVNNKSPNAAQRSFVHFALPTIPAGCSLTEAALRVYQIASPGARTVEAYQAAATPTWTESNLSWNNSPAPTGTPATAATATNQWRTWDVTSIVAGLYAGTNNGFVLKDSAEGSGTERKQEFASREDTSYFDAELFVAWG